MKRMWRPRSLARVWRRYSRTKMFKATMTVAGLVLLATILVYDSRMPTKVDPAAYAPLLSTIAKGESNGNYNAYFGNAANATLLFTGMSVGEVLQWQEEYVRQGSRSSAVGKYQIIRPTLTGLVRELGIDPKVRFDEALQDRLAIALMERRGAVAYIDKELTREQFAANLAKEWAALPKVLGTDPEKSYYASDGINHSRISINDIYGALALFEHEATAEPTTTSLE